MDKTVAKAMRLLETLAAHAEPQRVSELARELGLAKSNVHRLLRTLVALGHVRQDADGLYAAALRLWEVGTQVLNRLPIQRVAADHLRRLAAASGERIQLSILDGNDVLYIQGVESEHPVRVRVTIGFRAPACIVATGRAMLAFQAEPMIRQAARQLESLAPGTTPERFRQQLADIRRRGYAINLGLWRSGLYGVAAPVTGPEGQVDAAISLSGPAERLDARRLRLLAPMVVETAQAIALDLAYDSAGAVPVQSRRVRQSAGADPA